MSLRVYTVRILACGALWMAAAHIGHALPVGHYLGVVVCLSAATAIYPRRSP